MATYTRSKLEWLRRKAETGGSISSRDYNALREADELGILRRSGGNASTRRRDGRIVNVTGELGLSGEAETRIVNGPYRNRQAFFNGRPVNVYQTLRDASDAVRGARGSARGSATGAESQEASGVRDPGSKPKGGPPGTARGSRRVVENKDGTRTVYSQNGFRVVGGASPNAVTTAKSPHGDSYGWKRGFFANGMPAGATFTNMSAGGMRYDKNGKPLVVTPEHWSTAKNVLDAPGRLDKSREGIRQNIDDMKSLGAGMTADPSGQSGVQIIDALRGVHLASAKAVLDARKVGDTIERSKTDEALGTAFGDWKVDSDAISRALGTFSFDDKTASRNVSQAVDNLVEGMRQGIDRQFEVGRPEKLDSGQDFATWKAGMEKTRQEQLAKDRENDEFLRRMRARLGQADYGGGMSQRARDFMARRRAWVHGTRAAQDGGVATPDPDRFREAQRRAAAVAAYQSGVTGATDEDRGWRGRGFEPKRTPDRDPRSFQSDEMTNLNAALHSFNPDVRAEAQDAVDRHMQSSYTGQGNYAPDGTMIAPSAVRPNTGQGPSIDIRRGEGRSEYQRRMDLLHIGVAGGTVANAKGGRTVRADSGGGISADYPGSLSSAMTGDAIVDPLLRQVAGNEVARREYNRIFGEHYKAKNRSMDTGAAVIRALWQSGTISRDSARDLVWRLREHRDRKLAATGRR